MLRRDVALCMLFGLCVWAHFHKFCAKLQIIRHISAHYHHFYALKGRGGRVMSEFVA